MDLKDKKILLISVRFFDYEKAIAARLQNLGAEVDFFDERPANSVWHRGIIRVRPKLLQRKINRYYRKILVETAAKQYDYFLLIKGEAIPLFFLKEIKLRNPRMQSVCYTFDSMVEHPRFLEILPFFDRKFTFDPKDAEQYDMHFRPLFFVDTYLSSASTSADPELDMVFIGTAHSDRYILGEKVRTVCETLGLSTFFYYYAPGLTAFWLKRIFDPNFRKFDVKKVSFKKMSHAEIVAYYHRTKSVLDINKPYQQGLTMRTFEVLAAGKKLVTTNPDVSNYPFYDDHNILVISRDEVIIPEEFLKTGFRSPDPQVLEMMSLDFWISCLLTKDQDSYWNKK